jgi:hypothetical protein
MRMFGFTMHIYFPNVINAEPPILSWEVVECKPLAIGMRREAAAIRCQARARTAAAGAYTRPLFSST